MPPEVHAGSSSLAPSAADGADDEASRTLPDDIDWSLEADDLTDAEKAMLISDDKCALSVNTGASLTLPCFLSSSYVVVSNALRVLIEQERKALRDIAALLKSRREALADPVKYVEDMLAGVRSGRCIQYGV